MRSGYVVFFAVLLLLLSGCSQPGKGLGLKDASDCEDPGMRASQKIDCLHTAATTQASVFNNDEKAREICKDIYGKFSAPQTADDESPEKAELVTNNCLFDVAKLTHTDAACNDIHAWRAGASIFDNDFKTLRQMCYDQFERYKKYSPQDYFTDPNHTNLCSVLTILPFVVLASLFYNRGEN